MHPIEDRVQERPAPHFSWPGAALTVFPGLFLTCSIAAAAFALRLQPRLATFSPMILAVLAGILIRNTIGLPPRTHAGVIFSIRRVLRAAIVLLGMQLTIGQVISLGVSGALIVTSTLVATFVFTVWTATLLGVDRRLAYLIGAGTSVCGASAVVAANAVADAGQDDVTYSVAAVTVLGTVAMFAYPPIATLLVLSAHDYGLWAGASIHEIAQVVAASFQHGNAAGEFGTLAKLSRVILLAPLVLTLGALMSRVEVARGHPAKKPPVPWFVFGFLCVIAVNSLLDLSSATRSSLMSCTAFMLSVALAAMGLETEVKKILGKGLKPLLLAVSSTLFISIFSIALIKVFG